MAVLAVWAGSCVFADHAGVEYILFVHVGGWCGAVGG